MKSKSIIMIPINQTESRSREALALAQSYRGSDIHSIEFAISTDKIAINGVHVGVDARSGE